MPAKKNDSELLKLLNQRAAWNLPRFRKPLWNGKDIQAIDAAEKLHAEADPSNPYAYQRMKMHLLRGLDSAVDVAESARLALGARASARFADAAE